MLKSNLKVINNDVKTLVKDAQELLQAAAALTGEQAKKYITVACIYWIRR